MCVEAHVWIAEDGLWVSFLSFHHVSPENKLGSSVLAASPFMLWAISLALFVPV